MPFAGLGKTLFKTPTQRGLAGGFGAGKRGSSNLNVRWKVKYGGSGARRRWGQRLKRGVSSDVRGVLFKAGALTRRIARNSIKSRKSRAIKSAPGQPPINHVGRAFGMKWIEFNVHPTAWSVIVGANRIHGAARYQINPTQTTPNVLEYGGSGIGRAKFVTKTRRRKKNGQYGKSRINVVNWVGPVRVEPRPFINPAGRKAQKVYPQLFRNMI